MEYWFVADNREHFLVPHLHPFWGDFTFTEVFDNLAYCVITIINTVFRFCGHLKKVSLSSFTLHLVNRFCQFIKLLSRNIPLKVIWSNLGDVYLFLNLIDDDDAMPFILFSLRKYQ